MKVLAQTWFSSGRGLVGVVKAQNDEGEVGYYISPVDGFNEVIDANNVAAWGARFPWAAGEALFKEVV